MNTVRRSALPTTNSEEQLSAAAAIIGLSVTPNTAKQPAASGMHTQL